jgi:hypothetical protein
MGPQLCWAPPQPVIVHPVYAGYKSCQVAAAAGFLLDLYVNNKWMGSAISLGIDARTTFTLPTAFQAGDQISCTMTVCGMVGKPVPPVTVALQPPSRPVLLDPPNGADHVLLQPAFIWKDPGAGTPGAALSYLLHVTQSGNTIINQPLSATSFTSPVMLATDTEYQWNVVNQQRWSRKCSCTIQLFHGAAAGIGSEIRSSYNDHCEWRAAWPAISQGHAV